MCGKEKNERFGINSSIICIVTLFLAEYCGFGWVVGTFFWVFWFCFAIACKKKLKLWWSRGHPAGPSDLRSGLRSALRASSGLRGGNGGPACLPANFQAIAKKNQNIRNKVPTTQPNPQYSAKNNVTIHVIALFMPKCNCHYCHTISLSFFLSR